MNIRRIVLIIPLVMASYIILLLFFGFDSIINALKNFNVSYILLILICMFLSQTAMVLRGQYLLKSAGINIPLKETLPIFLSSWALFFFPAKTGELSKCYFLKKVHKAPFNSSLAVVFTEQVMDLIVVLLFSFFGIYFFGVFNDVIWLVFLILALFGLMVLIISNKKAVGILIKLVSKLPFVKKFTKDADIFIKKLKGFLDPKKFTVALFFSLVYWFFSSSILYLILRGFGVRVPIILAMFAFPFSILIGIVSTVPGGIGTSEGSALLILISQNINSSIAAVSIVMLRIFTLWIPSILGVYGLLSVMKKIKKNG